MTIMALPASMRANRIIARSDRVGTAAGEGAGAGVIAMWEGLDPTLIVSTTARVAVLITETL
ncbi:hypothetical protein D3C80_809870 [compost metagenome]